MGGTCSRCGDSGHYARNCRRAPRAASSTPGAHAKLSIKDKRSEARVAIRASAMRCPECLLAVPARDLLAHLTVRCEGRTPPHPADEWITDAGARVRGVAHATLYGWVDRGLVRIKLDGDVRRFLLRDVVLEIALRMRRRRLTGNCR